MEFLHTRKYLGPGQSVEVDCDTQCNVMLTDDHNFTRFKSRSTHTYFGGHRKFFPTVLTPPHAGWWNITIDLDGRAATIRHSITIRG
ncbi:DUF1883 domain-containing protein [Alienimonas chondri]|uniref:DUF1883 domain-containing protein n=1 Tax=Alienimonas chondri TaxID=2681879 RepID=A0ABX1VDE1_9PLAN|nr:hypothetical protein [Alienimonas chondri]